MVWVYHGDRAYKAREREREESPLFVKIFKLMLIKSIIFAASLIIFSSDIQFFFSVFLIVSVLVWPLDDDITRVRSLTTELQQFALFHHIPTYI